MIQKGEDLTSLLKKELVEIVKNSDIQYFVNISCFTLTNQANQYKQTIQQTNIKLLYFLSKKWHNWDG